MNWKTWTGTATFWKTLSKRSLLVFLAGVFCLFGSLGFILDSRNPQETTAGELTMKACRRLHGFQRISYLAKNLVHIDLVEADPFPHDLRRDHFILHLRKYRGIQVRKLALAVQSYVRLVAPRARPPGFGVVLQTPVFNLKYGGKLSSAIVPRDRFTAEENSLP